MMERAHTRMTIGELVDRLQTNLFPSPCNSLELLCGEREKLLKEYIDIVSHMITQHNEYRKNYGGRMSFWRSSRIDTNIENLCDYTVLLAEELDKERIISHCKCNSR